MGWGNRFPHIVLGACIPVTVQEHVHQAFDDVLPYQDFSLVLAIKDMPNFLDILDAVPKEDILRYREEL